MVSTGGQYGSKHYLNEYKAASTMLMNQAKFDRTMSSRGQICQVCEDQSV